MSSLYIGGAQCKHALFQSSDDWEFFDEYTQKISELASKNNVVVDRYSLDDGHYSFVILNKEVKHQCFYSGAAFSYDMTIETSDDFDHRSNLFIENLNKNEYLVKFHNLKWSKTENLYFSVS